MLRSHSFTWADFKSAWYKHWAKELYQDNAHLEGHALHANKFWQNAVMVQALAERGALVEGRRGVGFGVGQERLPALFAKLGINVTATDQDFTTQKAGHWSERELARSAQSLNGIGICSKAKFAQHLTYMSVDMKKIPKELFDTYDFVWSNCALGHLGSIPAGLKFIEQSLRCLIPGGWAVHTTELNILSEDGTVTSGSTVIFRLKDIYALQKKLVARGFMVSPFWLTLGKLPEDKRITLAPQFGNDYTKIQLGGHLATQVLLIIHKPKDVRKSGRKRVVTLKQQVLAYTAYRKNILKIRRYKKTDPLISQLLEGRLAPVEAIKLTPEKDQLHVKIPKGDLRKIRISYRNESHVPLLGVYTELTAKPIVLATTNPADRRSKFMDSTWVAPNRPSTTLWRKVGRDRYEPAEYVQPPHEIAFELALNSAGRKKGIYQEDFSLVQELVGWVPNTTVQVNIEVT